jgi:prolyl oligopeptidase
MIACGSSSTGSHADGTLGPPRARKTADVDNYHGSTVPDPYRWLENQDDPEVLAWADAQSEYAASIIGRSPVRDELRSRLTELWSYERYSSPTRHGDYWLYQKNDGLQDQSVLYKTEDLETDGDVLLDPNEFSSDGSAALKNYSASEHGKYLAYSVSMSGSDWQEWHVIEVATGRVLEDHLRWTKFTNAEWTHDEAGFFYMRYPEPEEGAVFEAANSGAQLCYHRLGTDQDADQVVYERPDQPSWSFAARVSRDGKLLIITAGDGTDRRNRILWLDLTTGAWDVEPMLMRFDASYEFLGIRQDRMLFLTDLHAPRNRIVSLDPQRPAVDSWEELIPQSRYKLESAHLVGGEIITLYLDEAKHRLTRYSLSGDSRGDIPLSEPGTVSDISGKPSSPDFFFALSSMTRPESIYRFDLSSENLEVIHSPQLDYDSSELITKQVAFQSTDGTRCMMFLMHRRDLKYDASSPCYLYGYGGFNISLTPRFSVPNIVWAERGGVYAQATLRGGGEFGENWHEAGMRENKQSVFDDFLAAARYLLRNQITSRDMLAIGGRSNGGLLVGACLTQAPDMFGAAIPEVGVLDMLRYHRFTIGSAWIPEYGSSDDQEMFSSLFAYSPLHNLAAGTEYPPTLIMTGDHDDRVLPGHSYKFAATLQEAQGGTAPILLRVTKSAGHGSGKPVRVQIEEAVDRWAFLDQALGSH